MFVLLSHLSGGCALAAAIPLWLGPRHQPQSVSSRIGNRSAADTDAISTNENDAIASSDFMKKVRSKSFQ